MHIRAPKNILNKRMQNVTPRMSMAQAWIRNMKVWPTATQIPVRVGSKEPRKGCMPVLNNGMAFIKIQEVIPVRVDNK